MVVRRPFAFFVSLVLVLPVFISRPLVAQTAAQPAPSAVFGYSDFTAQAKVEEKFLAVPDARLAGEELKILTAEPHLASSPEDRKTAEYVARKWCSPTRRAFRRPKRDIASESGRTWRENAC